jgi:hypothetical protein
MKLSTALVLSGLLAITAQACTRILVNEIWQSRSERTRDITLWDQDKVSGYKLPSVGSDRDEDVWQGAGYYVKLNWNNDGGVVQYPNNLEKRSATLRLDIPRRTESYSLFRP